MQLETKGNFKVAMVRKKLRYSSYNCFRNLSSFQVLICLFFYLLPEMAEVKILTNVKKKKKKSICLAVKKIKTLQAQFSSLCRHTCLRIIESQKVLGQKGPLEVI